MGLIPAGQEILIVKRSSTFAILLAAAAFAAAIAGKWRLLSSILLDEQEPRK